jgi:hypothetical protein
MSTSHRPLCRLRRHLLAVALASAFTLPSAFANGDSPWCGDRCDQVVLDWNQAAHQVIKAADGYANPLTASRSLAMTHLAMHDAVNSVKRRYTTYAVGEAAVRRRGDARSDEALAAVAASAAAHDLLLALYPTQKDLLRARLDESLHDAGIGTELTDAVAAGQRAAAAVLARRANDDSQGAEDYREGSAPGNYRFVPGTNFILMPHWRKVQPFALRSPDQFRVAAPPALGSAEYTEAFNEVKSTGSDAANAARTPDQSHYAAFWYEFSDAGWNRVARVVAREHKQDLWERARTFALLNVAMADSYIAGWDSKLHHDFWRPVTAIRLAGTDGNPATQPDAGWNSFLPTPPIQDHPSTHSALGAAAATVLAHAFGRDLGARSPASARRRARTPIRGCARGCTSASRPRRGCCSGSVSAGMRSARC